MPVSKVRVTPMEIGGGFGGKFTAYTDVPAALLSKKAGHRPVKVALSRTEVLQATGPTSGSYITVKIGATKDGKITAAQAELIYEAGAYPGSPVGAGSGVILAPYKLDNVQIDGYDVVVNKPKTAAYRAPGGTNAAFASESVIERAGREARHRPAGVPTAQRRCGRRPPAGWPGLSAHRLCRNRRGGHEERPLSDAADRQAIAGAAWRRASGSMAAGESSVAASVNPDGRVNLIEGSTDIGGSRASMAISWPRRLASRRRTSTRTWSIPIRSAITTGRAAAA